MIKIAKENLEKISKDLENQAMSILKAEDENIVYGRIIKGKINDEGGFELYLYDPYDEDIYFIYIFSLKDSIQEEDNKPILNKLVAIIPLRGEMLDDVFIVL